jgi:hypothetical protein
VLCRAVLCCAVLCCAVLCCAVLCCAVLRELLYYSRPPHRTGPGEELSLRTVKRTQRRHVCRQRLTLRRSEATPARPTSEGQLVRLLCWQVHRLGASVRGHQEPHQAQARAAAALVLTVESAGTAKMALVPAGIGVLPRRRRPLLMGTVPVDHHLCKRNDEPAQRTTARC